MSCSNPCTRIRYEFVSIDGPPDYVYKPITGKPDAGTLDPNAHQDYIQLWLTAFMWWMGFGIIPTSSPFRTVEPECGDCECDFATETAVLKQFTYTPPDFQLKNGKLSLSAKFTMRVISQLGVCTIRKDRKLSMAGREARDFLASLPALKTNLKPPGRNA
ncbi:hypothetical protein [Arenimonas sp.]|uniref:hypothetical protein n=1 Tax=Arenimonas sp. TaxID=1872635 RepID=UPI0039E2949C